MCSGLGRACVEGRGRAVDGCDVTAPVWLAGRSWGSAWRAAEHSPEISKAGCHKHAQVCREGMTMG